MGILIRSISLVTYLYLKSLNWKLHLVCLFSHSALFSIGFIGQTASPCCRSRFVTSCTEQVWPQVAPFLVPPVPCALMQLAAGRPRLAQHPNAVGQVFARSYLIG